MWISNHTPLLTDFGGGQRSNLIYRTLRNIGEVDVLLLAPKEVQGRTLEELYGKPEGRMEVILPTTRGQLFPWNLFRWCHPALIDRIAYNIGRRKLDYCINPAVESVIRRLERETQYDLYIGRHIKYSAQAGLLCRTPTIIDVDDNEIEYYRLLVKDPSTNFLRRLVLRRRIKTLEKLFPIILPTNIHLWVSKEEDKYLPGMSAAKVLPNIPYALSLPNPPCPLPMERECKTILFVGMLSYIYNRKGIEWFIKKVWLIIRREVKDVRFWIVGSRIREEDKRMWASVPGVKVLGFVKDVAQAYTKSALVVVPVWSGGGTNIKVL